MIPYALMTAIQETVEEASPTDWGQVSGVIILLVVFLIGKFCFPDCD